MTCNEWTILLIGAAIGAVIGLFLTILYSKLANWTRKKKLKNYFKPYNGEYNVRTKSGGSLHLISVKISHKKFNILKIDFETLNNGKATGHIIVNEITLKYGKAFYHHISEDNKDMSGIYDLLFIKEGIIHAKLLYIKGTTREEIIEQYIFEKK